MIANEQPMIIRVEVERQLCRSSNLNTLNENVVAKQIFNPIFNCFIFGPINKIMKMQNEPNVFGDLFESVNDYLETRVDLLKLKTIDKSSDIISSLASSVVILVIVTFGIILLNIGLSIWLGNLMGNMACGFFAVGGFYTILAIVLFGYRRKWLKGPFNDMFVKKMLN